MRVYYQRSCGTWQIDCDFVEERPGQMVVNDPSQGLDRRTNSRADDIFARNRIDGVKAKSTEQIPSAHLPAILVLGVDLEYCDSRPQTGLTHPGQSINSRSVVVLSNFSHPFLGSRWCPSQRVEVWNMVRRLCAGQFMTLSVREIAAHLVRVVIMAFESAVSDQSIEDRDLIYLH